MKHFTDINDLSNIDLKKIIAFTKKQKKLIKIKKVSQIKQILKHKILEFILKNPQQEHVYHLKYQLISLEVIVFN